MRHPAIALVLLAGASQAIAAHPDRFTGGAIALGLAAASTGNTVETSQGLRNDAIARGGGGTLVYHGREADPKAAAVPMLDVAWLWRLNPDWVAGIGAYMDLAKSKGPAVTTSISRASGPQDATLSLRQHAALYARVGRQLGEHWLLYGKLGYHRARADSGYVHSLPGPARVDSQRSFALQGVGIGFGAVRAWTRHLELRMEGEYIAYNRYTHTVLPGAREEVSFSGKPTQVRAGLLLGYRF